MLQALLDFSNQLGNADTILYLIPCTREYTEMIKQNRELLESRFVIAMPGQASLEKGLEGMRRKALSQENKHLPCRGLQIQKRHQAH